MFSRVSLDANGNERRKVQRSTSLTSREAPLSLGVFARTLLEKANEDHGSKDGNDDELSPNSIRQLMFFHPRSNPKPIVYHEPDPTTENIPPTPNFADSALVNSVSTISVTDALDLSVGSTNKGTILSTVLESTDENIEPKTKNCENRRPVETPSTTKLKQDGFISIRSGTQVHRPSPPLVLTESSGVSLKCAAIVQQSKPSIHAESLTKSRVDSGLGELKPRKKKVHGGGIYGTVHGTPKNWNPSSYLQEQQEILSSASRVKRETIFKPSLADSWNLGTESVQGKDFLIIKTLGKGGSGEVFLVVEKEHKNLFAMKKVHFAGVNESIIRECVNEITMLQELKGTELVIRIDSWEINKVDKTMKIIMEYGHSDLGASLKASKFTLQEVRSTWESILRIVSIIHAKGIVHADLKPANFVWVGHRLKIIDFGIASRLQSDNTSILMLNPKGTVNYISPETISPDEVTGKLKIGPKSDIWSLGCILYLLVYGKTPFHAYTTYVSKVGAIVKGIIHYPPLPPEFEGSGVSSVLKMCFQMDHRKRASADELLRHPFLAGPLSFVSHA